MSGKNKNTDLKLGYSNILLLIFCKEKNHFFKTFGTLHSINSKLITPLCSCLQHFFIPWNGGDMVEFHDSLKVYPMWVKTRKRKYIFVHFNMAYAVQTRQTQDVISMNLNWIYSSYFYS